jgi:triosephosphate isomerase (TIM)
MRRPIVAGNWKMHTTLSEAVGLAEQLVRQLNVARIDKADVVLAPPFTHLYRLAELLANKPNLHLGGQNCHQEVQGAYTGEVSAPMLRSLGASYVILGHSERRQYFGEDDALIARKVKAALEHNLRPIFCLGEALEDRDAGRHLDTVARQLREGLFGLDADRMRQVVMAYEPVWAIGTGRTASPEQAQEVHAFLRAQLAGHFGAELAAKTRILYGGSVKPDNAATLFDQADIDGGLIGGASLKAEDFLAIVYSLPSARR